jgi:hypothetical protein
LRAFFATLELHLGIVKGFDNKDRASPQFGGILGILGEDFHQFLPVAIKETIPI